MCICAEGFGGPDCATKLDGGQLVWETLMDSRLSAVSVGTALSVLWAIFHLYSWNYCKTFYLDLALGHDLGLTSDPLISTLGYC